MSETTLTTDGAEAHPSYRPYAPSWVDQLTAVVERLPGPAAAYYALLAGILFLVQVAIQWSAGNVRVETMWALLAISPAYCLLLIHYLDSSAAAALRSFQPALNCDDLNYRKLRYRIVTMPAAPIWITTLLGIGFGLVVIRVVPYASQLDMGKVAETTPSLLFTYMMLIVATIFDIHLIYHSWHQLRVVNEIFDQHTVVNLFHLRPLYAFSDLSARTAIGLLIFVYMWVANVPILLSNPLTGAYSVIFLALAALTFIFPLLGIHHLLMVEKNRLLVEAGRHQKLMTGELHRRVQTDDIADMDNLNKAMGSLELIDAAIKRIPTWPWQPETPRAVLAALFFPVSVWLVQWILQRLLGH